MGELSFSADGSAAGCITPLWAWPFRSPLVGRFNLMATCLQAVGVLQAAGVALPQALPGGHPLIPAVPGASWSGCGPAEHSGLAPGGLAGLCWSTTPTRQMPENALAAADAFCSGD